MEQIQIMQGTLLQTVALGSSSMEIARYTTFIAEKEVRARKDRTKIKCVSIITDNQQKSRKGRN